MIVSQPGLHDTRSKRTPRWYVVCRVAQHPRWADLLIKQVRSAGTDNAIYRIGKVRAVRRPKRMR